MLVKHPEPPVGCTMIISQVIELQPSEGQESAFRSHAAAARIARKDLIALIALWREEESG